MKRIPDTSPETPWQQSERVSREAETIEQLIKLRMERGNTTRADALQWAMDQWRGHTLNPE